MVEGRQDDGHLHSEALGPKDKLSGNIPRGRDRGLRLVDQENDVPTGLLF